MPDVTLEWFGCATFRLRYGPLTLFFDTYVDRPPAAGPNALTSTTITDADFAFVSHAHFDHVLGANVIAASTGALVVGNYETARLMREAGVPDAQVLPVSGGETVDCGQGVAVRVIPSIHSCLFAGASLDSGVACLGDLGVSAQDRRARAQALFGALTDPGVLPPDVADWFGSHVGPSSSYDGGQLAYLVTTPEGSLLVSGSSGCWQALFRDLRPDVAILAVNGRPNLDGEPFQGSLAEFVAHEVELLKPREVVLCHHDALLPPLVGPVDVGPVHDRLADSTPAARLIDLQYADGIRLFR